MTMKATNDHTAAGGTIDAIRDADRRIGATRAQTELIELLARLVLASVEQEQAHAGETAHPPI